MADLEPALSKLRVHISKTRKNHSDSGNTDGEEDYVVRINKTLTSLQNQIKQHQVALEKLRADAPQGSLDEPSHSPKARLEQLHIITKAYKSLAQMEPTLPSTGSPLPPLLAVRATLNTIDQSKTSIRQTNEDIREARERLDEEQGNLQDGQELTAALEKRIDKLRVKNDEIAKWTFEEQAQTMVREQQEKGRKYLAETKMLIKAFNNFVDEHLAAMLAAEDLGGPVVGDLIDIDAEALRTSDPKREQGAAAAHFRSLTEDLLNAAASEGAHPYVDIQRESAAVRFLVRSKVALFDPDNSRKLRLVDFGRELDD